MSEHVKSGVVLCESLQRVVDEGHFDSALSHCRERLDADLNDADAHRHLALVQAAQGELPLALSSARRACELAPDDPRSWSDLGRVHAMEGKLDDAARCFSEAIEIDLRFADGWHNLGTALKKLGDQAGAFTALKNALVLDPTRAETYLNLGNLLIEADQFEDAVECFERAAKHDPNMARARSRLAQEWSARRKVRRAESLFRQSLALNPDHVEGWFGLGRTLEDLGEAKGALGCYANVLRRRPAHAPALGHYLGLATGEEAGEWGLHAQTALADPAVNDDAKALIGYGLAKYHDRRGEFREAAQAGAQANAARRRSRGPLDRAQLTARVKAIIDTYTSEFFTARRRYGIGTDQPVFIVGLPRSGTTLTEQILSAHPLLHGAGELPDLARIAARCVADGEESWRAALRLDEMKTRELAHRYLRALRDGAPKRRLRISDKSPLNFFQLAFAALLFPGARVIHCRRDARDNALSIWMENFNPDQRYATDFEDLAFFTLQHQRLMAHWRAALPLRMLEVQYGDTVADVEAQARKLVAFLDAPWDSRCLEFHKSERVVQTPSRWQVRQPIYSRSVRRWHKYAQYLTGLTTAFAEQIADIETSA